MKSFLFSFSRGVTEMHVQGIKGTSCSEEVSAVQGALKAKLAAPPQYTDEFYQNPATQTDTSSGELTQLG